VLEPDAHAFSVPSKVLTYLAAGRPILAAMPRDNLASRIVESSGAGRVVDPGDLPALVAAARDLAGDRAARNAAGSAARAYAERAFDIEVKADRFEAVIGPVARLAHSPRAPVADTAPTE
jgi:glycosyltransferase involved in cell wall biosynthesis